MLISPRTPKGFTLLELMVVIAIIGILGSMAIPTYQNFVIRAQVTEAMELADSVKKSVTEYYESKQQFPKDNAAAGVAKPKHLIGNYVTQMTVEKGAIHISLGHRINAQVAAKILTLRPAVVRGSPKSPISWLCGYAQAVEGMEAQGENNTTLPSAYVSPECRRWENAVQ